MAVRRRRWYCCVPFCENSRNSSFKKQQTPSEITFHNIPLNSVKRKQWLDNMRLGDDFQITKYTKVCSVHFLPNDFRALLHAKKQYLTEKAVPTVFSWSPTPPVCELHFTEDQIRRETSCIDPQTGKTVTAPLIKLRLKEDAVPTLHINDSPVGKMSTAKRSIRSCDSVKSEKGTKITSVHTRKDPSSVQVPLQQNSDEVATVKVKKKCKSDSLMSPSTFLAEIEELERRTYAAEQELQKIVAFCSSKNVTR